MKQLLLLLLILPCLPVFAWDNNDIDTYWQTDNLAALQALKPESEFASLYQDYRIAMVAMRMDDKKLAKKSLNRIQKTLKNNYQTSDEAALYSASLGLSITLTPWRAAFIGKQAEDALAFSESEQKSHAPTLMVQGIALYNTPALLGGDRLLAMERFKEALALYEQEEAWGYEDAWFWYIKALIALEQTTEAEQMKATALSQFPDYIELQELL